MRGIFVIALAVLSSFVVVQAQVISSHNSGCAVNASGGTTCNGIVTPRPKNEEPKLPKLSVTHFTIEPGGAFGSPSSSADFLIIGIQGGDLLNEEAPFRHVSLAKDEMTLLPKGQAFRLRNTTAGKVEFRLVEIQR